MFKNLAILILASLFISSEAWSIIIPSAPYLAQKNYRWRNDDGNETSATWKAGLNSAYTLNSGDLGTNFRLRIEFDNTGDDIGTIPNTLQYSTDGVTWVNITATAGTNHWMFATSPNVTHDAATTAQLVSGLGGTYTAGKIISNTTGGSLSISYILRTENEYVIRPTNNIQSHSTYYFRVNGLSSYVQNGIINTSCLARITAVNHGEVCEEGQTVTLSASALPGNTITWFDDADVVVGSGSTFTTPPIYENTIYYVQATGSTGCVSTKMPVMANLSAFEYTIHQGFVCGGGSVLMSVEHEPSTATVNWYNDASATTPIGTGSIFYTPDITETTTFYFVLSTPTCSTNPIPATATVRPLPTLVVSPMIDTICPGETTTLTSTINPNYTYSWDSGELTSSLTTDVYGNHTLTVTDVTTTCQSTVSAFVDTLLTASVDGFDFVPLIHTDFKKVTFYPINDIGTSDYLWDFGDDNTSSDRVPTHTFEDTGRYVVTLIVSNKCNADTVDLELFIRPENTSIDDSYWNNLVQVYPNPTQGNITIQSDITRPFSQVSVINTLGQLILNNNVPNTTQYNLNLSQYPKGQYFIMLADENGHKIVKPIILQ